MPHPTIQRIQVFQGCRAVRVSQAEMQRAATQVLRRLRVRRYDLSLAVLDDAGLAELNRRYRNRRGPTDVLAFDLREDASRTMEGQIVISAETAHRQARQRRISAKTELMLYLIHGILHLAGFDDTTPQAARQMRRQEQQLLQALGYTKPPAADKPARTKDSSPHKRRPRPAPADPTAKGARP
jgi:probable rRNA maturation factor